MLANFALHMLTTAVLLYQVSAILIGTGFTCHQLGNIVQKVGTHHHEVSKAIFEFLYIRVMEWVLPLVLAELASQVFKAVRLDETCVGASLERTASNVRLLYQVFIK